MAFEIKETQESWLADLPLGDRVKGDRVLPDHWACAVDVDRGLLFTQLRGSSEQMRDGLYHYVLADRENVVIVAWESGLAKIVSGGDSFPVRGQGLAALINEAAVLYCADNKLFVFSHAA